MVTSLLNQLARACERGAISSRFASAVVSRMPRSDREGYLGALIENFQGKRLRRTISWAAKRSPFYERLLDAAGVEARSIRTPRDLASLPFTTEAETRSWQAFLCVATEDIARITTTEMGADRVIHTPYSARDFAVMTSTAAVILRAVSGCGGRSPFTAIIALPRRGPDDPDAELAREAVARAGGLAVSVAPDDLDAIHYWLHELSPQVIITTGRAAAEWAEARPTGSADERMPVRTVVLLEHDGAVAADSQRGGRVRVFGSSEIPVCRVLVEATIGGVQMVRPPGCEHYHINDLQLFAEIVDPSTGRTAPEGNLAITTLERFAMPLLRFRTSFHVRWAEDDCGIPTRSFDLVPRLADGLPRSQI